VIGYRFSRSRCLACGRPVEVVAGVSATAVCGACGPFVDPETVRTAVAARADPERAFSARSIDGDADLEPGATPESPTADPDASGAPIAATEPDALASFGRNTAGSARVGPLRP
jgi:hypothetical protein